ncbi:MAG: fluoride efflux transporter CrcB [Eubacteriales bacterium]
MDILLVGIGGAFGGTLRFFLGKFISERSRRVFPVATFLINISGAFLLGALYSAQVDNRMYMLLGDGFLGAYTTFSTFMYEGFSIFRDNARADAIIYVFGTVLIGITGFFAGYIIGKY